MQEPPVKRDAKTSPAPVQDERERTPAAGGGPDRGLDPIAEILRLQRTIGNRATAQLIAQGRIGEAAISGRRGGIVRGASGFRIADAAAEAEAERIGAEMLRPGKAAREGSPPGVRSGRLAPWPAALRPDSHDAALPPDVATALARPGEPLDSASRAFFEPRLGLSLADVRVHTDESAHRSATSRGARAYAYGPDLVFGRHQYAPHSGSGRALLSHELVHVAQQAAAGQLYLARQQGGDQPRYGETTTELRPGLKQVTGHGYTILQLAGRNWLRLEWDAEHHEMPRITVKTIETPDEQGIGLRVEADYPVTAFLDRSVEPSGKSSFLYELFSYDFRFPGSLQVNSGAAKPEMPGALKPGGLGGEKGAQRMKLPYRVREFYAPTPSIEFERPLMLNPPTPDSLDPLNDSPVPKAEADQRQKKLEEQRLEETIRGQPAFKTRAEMENYIRAHPNDSFIGIETSYGRFVARRINEDELQRLARNQRSEPDELPELAWGAEQRRSGWGVTGIYQGGRAIDLQHFAQEYYSEDALAGIGAAGDPEEAEIYRVGEHSFGRKSLPHDEALARWAELDTMASGAILRLETEPGHRFVSLWVRGVGQLHELDQRYFRGRDEFNKRIVAGAMLDADELDLFGAIEGSSDVRYFLLAETDREKNNPAFVETLGKRTELAEAVSRTVYDEVEDRAQRLALDRIVAGADQLRPYAEDPERMRSFVLGFPELNGHQREDALGFIGVPTDQRSYVSDMLSDRGAAMRVALGLEETHTETEVETVVVDNAPAAAAIEVTYTYRVSLELLMSWARDTVKGLEDAAEQLRSGDVEALWLEGELGDTIRARVYREFGFHLLDPKRFPHRDETSGWFPDPLQPGPLKFSSLAEQMYANRVHRLANDRRVTHVLEVTGLVVASIVLILVAQSAGAIAAGLLFAEGSAGFIVTELIVSGTVFTALNEVESRVLQGHWESESIGEFFGRGALNIAMFGAFRFLNTLLAAGARSFVAGRVGEEVFTASRGAQRAAEALRIGAAGASFLTIGIMQRLASGKGFSSGADFALFAYENLLTLALLEAGGVLSKPLMTKGGIWAREQRLGAFEGEISGLQGDLARMQRDIVSLTMRPQAAARDAPGLEQRAEDLLQRQAALCERLRESFRTRSDAKALQADAEAELKQIKDALGGMQQAKFLSEQHIVPAEGSESVFTYEGGEAAIEHFRKYYGADRVQVSEDGTIRVEVEGLETRDLVFVPAEQVAAPVAGGKPQLPTLVEQQLALQARQRALLSRARRLGVRDPSLDAISRLRPTQTTVPETLRRTEQAIAKAEREAGAAMDKVTRNILKNVSDRLGAGVVNQIRAGELSGVSDADLADILWQARSLQNMGVPHLRALVFAAQAGEPAIDFPKLIRTIRRGRFSVDDRNFALETFTHLMELKIPGTRQMLADMSTSTGHLRGGLFQMEVIRFIGGPERVKIIEARVDVGARSREYDITLRDGTRIECKDWTSWEHADSLADAFERDMLLLTENFAKPSGIRQMRYMFRLVEGKPVRPVAEIRAFLRERLDRMLTQRDATLFTRMAMLDAFDDFIDLVQAPDLQRSGGTPLPPIVVPPPSPALRRDDEDDEGASD